MTRHAVAYVRVSLDSQEASPETQREAISRWCSSNGCEVAESWSDLGVSGGAPLDKCPGLLAALRALKRGSVLVVAKRDRIGRDMLRVVMVEREVERKGATLVSADGAGNGDTPEAKMLRGLLATFAEYERALIRSRTSAVLRSMARRGLAAGGIPPYGWRKVGKALVSDPTEQATLARVRTHRANGLSWSQCARDLNDAGIRNRRGHAWTFLAVRSMVLKAGARSISAQTAQDVDSATSKVS